MVTTTQSTPPRTVTAKSGMILPATIDQQTDLNLCLTAISVYHVQSNRMVNWDTLIEVMAAMRDSSAVVVLYEAATGEDADRLTARVLWPNSVTLTKDNNIACKAYCTLRREVKTFRLDRMLTCHALTTPDDIVFGEEAHAA